VKTRPRRWRKQIQANLEVTLMNSSGRSKPSHPTGANRERQLEDSWILIHRRSLVPDIEALRTQAGEDEIFKTELAFVLCFFGHDYENNKNKITEALRASRYDHRFGSIEAESMIAELIRRGDLGLLSELFNTVVWSDGALSEGLVDTFVEMLVKNPNGFLLILSGASPETRRSVYRLTDKSSFPPDDLIKVRKSLSSASVPASLRPIARELLASLRSNRQSA